MLSVKNLTKIYKSKGGVETKALDNITLDFPSKGMIFLLGKSGSGKSTLLNVIGGLDKPTSGEIIIKGKNSKDFTGSDFDSYRNTYIGFVFQEYNILNEFNVEQNIALALELQGKKQDKELVEKYLEEVDLKGFNKRKPNTLSGGQKQRIAIARALVKNPEIIMADEPTGALDSNTGEQVLETLKKLSKEKLVIVVSHDHDFAERFGDRIIELADGKVINDVTKETVEPKYLSNNIKIINDNILTIENTKNLNEEDKELLFDAIKSHEGELIITRGKDTNNKVKEATRIQNDNTSEIFEETKNVALEKYNPGETKFIKSKMPFSRAFKIGSSGLKVKIVRLIFTIILTTVSLTMFGSLASLMFYDETYSVTEALKQSTQPYEILTKSKVGIGVNKRIESETQEVINEHKYDSTENALFGTTELNEMKKESGQTFNGIFTLLDQGRYGAINEVYEFKSEGISSTNVPYYQYTSLIGFTDASEVKLNAHGLTLVKGHVPRNKDEIVLSTYMGEAFLKGMENGSIYTLDDLLERDISFSSNVDRSDFYKFKIVGFYNTANFDGKYDILKTPEEFAKLEYNVQSKLMNQFREELLNSYCLVGFVDESFYEFYKKPIYEETYSEIDPYRLSNVIIRNREMHIEDEMSNFYEMISTDKLYERFPDIYTFYNLEGEEMKYIAPKEDEIYISYDEYQRLKLESFEFYLTFFTDYYFTNNYLDKEFSEAYPTNDSLSSLRQDFNSFTYRNYDALPQRAKEAIETYFIDIKNHSIIRDIFNEVDKINDESIFKKDEKFNDYFETINKRKVLEDSYYDEALSYIKLYKDAYKVGLKNTFLNSYATFMNSMKLNKELSDEVYEIFKDGYLNISGDSLNRLLEIANDANNTFSKYVLSIYNDTFLETDLSYIEKVDMPLTYYIYANKKNTPLKNIGFFGPKPSYKGYLGEYLLNHEFANKIGVLTIPQYYYINEFITDYVEAKDAKYNYVITDSDYSRQSVEYYLKNAGTYFYEMSNPIYRSVKSTVYLVNNLKLIFSVVGSVVGVFAALMLLNFIATSISFKKKEIGILRAVGAKGSDVFKIFYSEAGIISLICFALSVIATGLTCFYLNQSISTYVEVKIFEFGPINILLILAVALIISILATYLPVLSASKKAPVDSIRSL